MSSEPQSETGLEQEEGPRLASVEIGGWPGLGGNVGFDVGERVTVLVGKNGAGKSLIMEGLDAASESVLLGTETTPAPTSFHCVVTRPLSRTISYEYKVEVEETPDDESEDTEPPAQRLLWTERCWLHGARKSLWTVGNAKLQLRGHAPQPFVSDQGLLSRAILSKPDIDDMPSEATELAELFLGLRSVSAGIPREKKGRQEILLRRTILPHKSGKRFTVWKPMIDVADRMTELASSILKMKSSNDGRYDEFVEILQQLEVIRHVTIRQFKDQTRKNVSYASIEFDGVNFGYCSDGTQRIAQIIAELLSRRIRCLLIEEPETAVHPSLLSRLLAILESYALDRQIIITTHSPQIVDWCKPKDLRLVERIEGQTRVRSLDEKELDRVYNYLVHDGTLSDFVYRYSSE